MIKSELLDKNIVLVSRFPYDENQPRGGVETATVALAKALQLYGAKQIHIVTVEKEKQKPSVDSYHNLTVHRLPRSSAPMFLDVFNGPTARRLRKYIEALSPEIVHFHETWGFGASTYNLPTVFTVHGFDSLNLPTEKSKAWFLRKYLWRIAESRGLKKQNMLISIAPYVKKEIIPHTTAPIFEIWNALDEQYFSENRHESDHLVLFLGWINQRKNPLTLVEAINLIAKDIPSLRVELYGEHSDKSYVDKVKSAINKYKLNDMVKMPGRLSKQEVLDKLKQASMLVLPSLQENAPMVIAEAMALGVPVIASNLCGIPDMIEHEKTGFLTDPHDPKLIAKQIKRILQDKALRDTISQNSKAAAKTRYHPISVASSTVRCYQEAIKKYKFENQ